MENIVLIGLSGCGKTSFAKELSKKLSMENIDTDILVEKMENEKIKIIFAKYGEEYFREKETLAVIKSSKAKNSIISTGGGVVLKKDNMKYLKENGIIVFINREVKDIIKDVDVKERPLLQDGTDILYHHYNDRIHLYKKYADIIINNNLAFKQVTIEIIKQIEKFKNTGDKT